MAQAINQSPELQDEFLADEEFVRYFAKLNHLLRANLKQKAFELAKKLLLKVASQLVGTGVRKGTLHLRKGVFSDEVDLDATLENIVTNPLEDLEDNLATWDRKREEQGFVMMFDHSYSMRGPKIVLAALTAAAIAIYFKENYGVVAFSTDVEVVKGVSEKVHYEVLLDRIFDLPIEGLTNISGALAKGFNQLADFNRMFGLLLTDGGWTTGEDPMTVAAKFTKLNVIAFPPANPDKIRLLAEAGHGTFQFVEDEDAITAAIVRALQAH
ncbi:MAG: VWA domain-containing protein [Thermoleophilia bacterium]|nr:VWA domain-containing protein [Thermoleophilia bacterium]